MKAAFIERFGGPEVIQYGDLPDPVAGPGEVVVDIVAATVNAADWKVRLGDYKHTKFPMILGRDFSGLVSAVGDGVDDLALATRCSASATAGQEGAYAEKIAVKAAIVAKKPDGMSHIDAAALALIGLTAISAVEETLKLQRGETILIQGGAGGVASFAIQLAKHIGARVITTTSAAEPRLCAQLGADEVIDYNAGDFTKAVRTATPCSRPSAATWRRSPSRCSSRGAARPSSPPARRRQSPIATTYSLRPPVGRARKPSERIAELYQAGAIRPPEIKLFRFSQAVEAHRLSQSVTSGASSSFSCAETSAWATRRDGENLSARPRAARTARERGPRRRARSIP